MVNVHDGWREHQPSGLFSADVGIDLLTGKGCELRNAISFEGRCFDASQLKWSVGLTTHSICSLAPVLILSQFRGVCVVLNMALSIWLLD